MPSFVSEETHKTGKELTEVGISRNLGNLVFSSSGRIAWSEIWHWRFPKKKEEIGILQSSPILPAKRGKGFDFRGLQRVGWAARNSGLILITAVSRLFNNEAGDIDIVINGLQCLYGGMSKRKKVNLP